MVRALVQEESTVKRGVLHFLRDDKEGMGDETAQKVGQQGV